MIPSSLAETYEISNPIVEAGDSVLLAPAATLPDSKRLGERVVVFRSEDNGKTWPEYSTVFHDPEGEKGTDIEPALFGRGRLLLLSNRRYGNQGIAAYFARFNAESWVIEGDSLLWDARSSRNTETENTSGIDAFDDFAFGLPSLPYG